MITNTPNTGVLASKWKQLRAKVKQKWGALTEQDLTAIEGNADVLIGILQECYSYPRQKAEEEVSHFLNENLQSA